MPVKNDLNWKPDLSGQKGSISEKLISQLKEDIKNGVLLPGTKLPPQRDLAAFLGINTSTVSRAFKKCEEEGLLTSTVGSGTFIDYGALHPEYVRTREGASKTIELGVLAPTTINTPILSKALKEMASEGSHSELFGYRIEDSSGLWHKEAAVRLLARIGFQADPESIFFSAGGQNALAAVLLSLFKPGDSLGTDPLVFPGLRSVAALLGIRLIPVRTAGGEFTEEGLLDAVRKEKIKGIYVTPDIQNPTAHTMSERCKDMIAQVAAENDLHIIEDQIFSLLMKTPVSAIASRAPEHTVFIASISKSISPGLRTAYISAPEKCRSRLDNALSNINVSVSPVTLELSSRIIAGGHLDSLLDSVRAKNRARNLYVNRILNGYELHGPPECPFKWCVLDPRVNAEKLEDDLRRDHVHINASSKFAVGNIKPAPAIRLCSCAPNTDEELVTALKKIRKHVEHQLY